MCYKTLTCPLCCQTQFSNIEIFRASLIKVTNSPLVCPICSEILMGLDKLTIHIFGHTLSPMEHHLVKNEMIYAPNPHYHQYSHTINGARVEQAPPPVPPPPPLPSPPTVFTHPPKHESITSLTCPKYQLYQYKCDICDISLRTQEFLKMHRNILHDQVPGKETKFACHLCSKSFKMKGSLKLHLRVAHPTISAIPYYLPPPLAVTPDFEDNNSDGSSPSTSTGRSNRGNTVRVKCETVTAKNSTTSSDDPPKPWECDICAKTFTTKYFLKKHKRLHTGEMPYGCAVCGKTFTFQQSYHKHLLYHSDEKPHTCSTCGRSFKELSTLHNHERIHSGEKPFKCETCGKCFRQRVSYLVHRRIHTGVMPYQCNICHKSFRYKVSQRTHKCISSPSSPIEAIVEALNDRDLLGDSISNNNNPEEIKPASQVNEDNVGGVNETYSTAILDDILKESCSKMGLDGYDMFDTTVHSPSEKLQNLCLYSMHENESNIDTINEDCLKKLLFGD